MKRARVLPSTLWGWALLVGAGLALLAGAGVAGALWLWPWLRHPPPAGPPEPAREAIAPPAISSTIAVPLEADLSSLQRLLDREIPRQLWTIDQPGVTCAKPQRIKLLGARVPITPKLTCRIVGTARRGPITLHGEGQTIRADVPILAEVQARNVGGLVSARATGTAMAHARIRLTISRDWRAQGTIALAYDWTTPPGINLLGQRITFTDKADDKLRPVLARLERQLPGELARWNLRGQVADLWRQGFGVFSLNESHPPVWMRVVPQGLAYDGYRITGNRLVLRLGLVALTQAVVGHRPADPAPTALPRLMKGPVAPGTPWLEGQVRLFAPVIADYAELVPVIEKALTKRSARPFDLPGVGPVMARFERIEVYGASQGRIAVGADIAAQGRHAALRGRIWFAARPGNADGSQLVHFTDLTVRGATSRPAGDLLLAVANSPGFSQAIAEALQQNFTRDYIKLQGKIRRAIQQRRLGDFRIDARLDKAENGRLQPFANGLYMPVWLTGQARITYAPPGNRARR